MPTPVPARCSVTLPLLLAAVLVLPACAPRGESSGRLGVGTTTEDESERSQILPVALIEFSDQAPQQIIETLSQIPEIRDVPGEATIILGDLNNRTGIVSTNDFEVAARRLRNNLIRSPIGQDAFKFVVERARMERIAGRERVATPDGYLADPAHYDPNSTFALIGDFFRVTRGDTHYYYMEFQLVSFATNQIVAAPRYEIKQMETD